MLYSGIFAVLILGCNYTGIGIYGGLFLSNLITHSFDQCTCIGAIVIQLTAFYLDALQFGLDKIQKIKRIYFYNKIKNEEF